MELAPWDIGGQDEGPTWISSSAMSAPEPSGALHEHLHSFLRSTRTCVVTRLVRSLECLLTRTLGEDLPAGVQRVLHSQLSFLSVLVIVFVD